MPGTAIRYLELKVPGGEQFLKPGQAYGDVDADWRSSG